MTHGHRAYAKINIGLHILAKRADGYHDIETVFHKIDLFDDIHLSPSRTIEVVSSSHEAPSDESNICHGAARMLQEHLQIEQGVRIAITKRIPVGAGLGGGSSDAATTLKTLPAFWNRSVPLSSLLHLARQLGSDVPFFLGTGSALGNGRGDLLEYFDLDMPYYILLCNPNIHVATSWAYGQVKPRGTLPKKSLRETLINSLSDPEALSNEIKNDFEEAVFAVYPEIQRVKDSMLNGGAAFSSMSGSGSSVFGFFVDKRTAANVASSLEDQGFRTFLTNPHFTTE